MVTGTADVVRCSPAHESELFEAALSGLGQCGLIVSARLRLVDAPDRVKIFDLPYGDLASMAADLQLLVEDGRFNSLGGLLLPSPGGWLHILEAGSFRGPSGGPGDSAMLDDLGFVPGAEQAFEQPFFEFANRVSIQLRDLQAVGLLDAAHPWLGLFVPAQKAAEWVGEVLAG